MRATRPYDGDVGRVVWINGCFSSGKTSVATLLLERLPDSFLLDPDVIGSMLRYLVPPRAYPEDFQDLRLWRRFTRAAVVDAAERSDGVVVVPMTIARPEYFDEVIAPIGRRVPLDHFTLTASRETILEREGSRDDETGNWARKTVDWVLPALADDRFAVHIDAESQTVAEVADDILRRIAEPVDQAARGARR
jgi:chloramphenicol 3-O-phosphotransferase